MAGQFDETLLDHHLAPLRRHLALPGVTEVVVNRPGEVGVENDEGWSWHNEPDLTLDWLGVIGTLVSHYTQQTLSAETPICSTSLPSGERVQVVAPPAVEAGQYSVTIRKPSTRHFTLDALDEYGLFRDTRAAAGAAAGGHDEELAMLHRSGDWPEFLRRAVRGKKNILISGATGSAKTTLSKALIELIPLDERLITIEDTRELVMPHRNQVNMLYAKDGQGLAKVSAKELLEASLRMRPDRILLQAVQLNLDMADRLGGEANTESDHGFMLLSALAGGVLVVALLAVLLMRNRLTLPLGRIQQAMGEMAGGDLDRAIPCIALADEIGDIGRALEQIKEGVAAKSRAEAAEQAAVQGRVVSALGSALDRLREGKLDNRIVEAFTSLLTSLIDAGPHTCSGC